jgi:hypothetical protein
MVIAELFDKVFETYEGLRNLGTMVFRWATLVMVVLSIASVAALPNPDVRGIVGAILVMDRTVRVLQVGLMAFLFLFASYFRLALADLVFGIALGLTLYGCSDIVLSAARLHFGHDYAAMYSLLQSLAYNCAIFIWAAYIIRRQRMPLFDRRLSADQLHRWNDALLELLHQ